MAHSLQSGQFIVPCRPVIFRSVIFVHGHAAIGGTLFDVLSESFLHLPLRPIFRQLHPNFINVRTAYASEIWAQLTKNLLAKSSTKRFREYIVALLHADQVKLFKGNYNLMILFRIQVFYLYGF